MFKISILQRNTTVLSFLNPLDFVAQRKNFGAKPKQAGKKEGGLGEGIFARLLCPPKADWGWEAARPCASKEAKPAKIVSLIEKIFCARPLKEKEIFAGFAYSANGGVSRWAGLFKIRLRILLKESSNLVQKAPPISPSR
jgi:hypothetical protein